MLFKNKNKKEIKNYGLVMDKNPNSIIGESYRTLRTNITYSSFDKKIQTIVVTSANAGEGKSTVSGNLALTFAQNGNKVLLVDCDLRKPSIHKKFKISNMTGLSEILIGKSNLADSLKIHSQNLFILTSGKKIPNPSEMISSQNMVRFLDDLRRHFDIIVIDSPPVGLVTDAQVLSTIVDGTILVARAEETKIDRVTEAKTYLEKVNANILGCVLHAAKQDGNRSEYYGTED